MQQLTRSWPGLAASGAALLYAAVGAGLVVSGSSPLPLAIGALLIITATLHGAWSIAAFRAGTLVRPEIAIWLFLAPVLLWALVLFSPADTHAQHGGESAAAQHDAVIATMPMISAVLIDLALSVACAVRIRRPHARRAPAASGALFMVGLVVGALAISGIVTPALAASDAGLLAVPHGTPSAP